MHPDVALSLPCWLSQEATFFFNLTNLFLIFWGKSGIIKFEFKTWFYWWKLWKFGIRFSWKHVVNNSCFGIFMYKFVCFTMSSNRVSAKFKAFMQQQFHTKCQINEPLLLEMLPIFFLLLFLFLKIQKLSFNIFFHPFPPLKRLLTYEFFHFLYYNILCIPKTLWKEFSIPKILFLLQKQ